MTGLTRRLAALRADLASKEVYLLLSLGILVCDQWTKHLVETELPSRAVVSILPGLLNLTHVRNTGVAFGLFPAEGSLGGMVLLTLLGLSGFGLLAYYFVHTPLRQRLLLCSLSLVLGGALGNLADRIASGAVTDFVDLYWGSYHWYTFNLADSAITIGIVLMSVELLLPAAGGRPNEAAAAADPAAERSRRG
jgi:signal peptidase II